MTAKELSEVGRRYLFLRTELEECPELMHDESFMARYHIIQRMYKHYQRQSRQTKQGSENAIGDLQSSSVDGNQRVSPDKTADISRNWQGYINDIRKWNDSGAI